MWRHSSNRSKARLSSTIWRGSAPRKVWTPRHSRRCYGCRSALNQLQVLGARPAAAILAGRLPDRGARGLPRGPRSTTRENPFGLTARELEVLVLLGRGLHNAQVAKHLVISEKTVKTHVGHLLAKLGVSDRTQAALLAVEEGLVGPKP